MTLLLASSDSRSADCVQILAGTRCDGVRTEAACSRVRGSKMVIGLWWGGGADKRKYLRVKHCLSSLPGVYRISLSPRFRFNLNCQSTALQCCVGSRLGCREKGNSQYVTYHSNERDEFRVLQTLPLHPDGGAQLFCSQKCLKTKIVLKF